ncbi:MAG TPA: hypothetical protein VJT50_09460 [Pyrinomonadaceae bacterium]|nr:hypothetical protein [Pyrinomonadaceae bacterium]
MRIRLTALALLLLLASSAFAGMPMHSNEQSCPMGSAMGDMDCCKAALMQNQTPQVTTARLCCALNCSQDGTIPSNATRVSPPLQIPVAAYPVSIQPVVPSMFLVTRAANSHGPPTASHPAYIRNLSLLI